MCLQTKNSFVTLSPTIKAQLQRIRNKQRSCCNSQYGAMRKASGAGLRNFCEIRASCIHCIKGPYMTFSLKADTYATAITILDAFLWRVKVTKTLVSVVGVACLSIAAKLTEDDENVPGHRELADFSGHSWTANDLSRMEVLVLSKLKWDIPTVTYLDYLPLLADACGLDRSLVVSDRVILLAERCLRLQSSVLIPPVVLALSLVIHVKGLAGPLIQGLDGPLAADSWTDLITLCDMNLYDIVECQMLMGHVSSSTFKPHPLPAFCPRVRFGRKQFCRPSNKGSPKLSTIQEL